MKTLQLLLPETPLEILIKAFHRKGKPCIQGKIHSNMNEKTIQFILDNYKIDAIYWILYYFRDHKSKCALISKIMNFCTFNEEYLDFFDPIYSYLYPYDE